MLWLPTWWDCAVPGRQLISINEMISDEMNKTATWVTSKIGVFQYELNVSVLLRLNTRRFRGENDLQKCRKNSCLVETTYRGRETSGRVYPQPPVEFIGLCTRFASKHNIPFRLSPFVRHLNRVCAYTHILIIIISCRRKERLGGLKYIMRASGIAGHQNKRREGGKVKMDAEKTIVL